MITFYLNPSNAIALLQRGQHAISDETIRTWMGSVLSSWMEQETVNRFAYEGDFRSGHWEPLSEVTKRIREDEGYPPNEINVRTEELLNYALSSDVSYGVAGILFETPDSQGAVGEIRDKFMTAQQGSNNNPGHRSTPARPVVAFSEGSDSATIMTMFKHNVISLIGGVGV